MQKLIPFSRPCLGKNEIHEVTQTLKSGWITTGKKTELFESNFAKFVGSKYAVALTSGTAGLHLTLMALGIKENDEIITPSFTFISTINMITLLGGKPKFVDIHPSTWNVDENLIEAAITPRTKAIIPVHFSGLPCHMQKIRYIAKKYNLYLIEDTAHAIGSYYNNHHVGHYSDISIYSFHPNKAMTTGEGGMVTTNKKYLAEQIRPRLFHGISKMAWERKRAGYDIRMPGFKYNMMDLQASMGLHQLKRVSQFVEQRRRLSEIYTRELADVEAIKLQQNPDEARFYHSRNLFPIVLKTEKLGKSREEIIDRLKKKGIGVGIHFPAAHLCTYYKNLARRSKIKLPHTEYVANRIISLPLFPGLKSSHVNYVCQVLKSDILRS